MALAAGTRIAHYEVTGWLGAGGMGEVYSARDLKLDREVAIKLLSGTPDADSIRRFQREAKLLAALNHPHIAQIYGVEELDGRLALVLEFVDGEGLDAIIAASGGAGLPAPEATVIAGQVAAALVAAHQKGIVHRDLKPANIKLTRDRIVKVLDFGIAKTAADAPVTAEGVTQTQNYAASTIAGTVAYMSPEQALGRPIDARADIWSFGCVLFETLAARRPFAGETTLETIAAIIEREPSWDALPPGVPPHLRALLRDCLQKDPTRRPSAMMEVRQALSDPAFGGAAHDAGAQSSNRLRLRPAVLSVTAAAVLVMLAGLLSWKWILRGPAPLTVTAARQLTTHAAVEDYPTVSPDGQTIAFESNQSGTWDIWVTTAGTVAVVNRTADHAGDDRYPSWSPDGAHIAFWSDRNGGGYYLMPAVGGGATRIAGTDVGAVKLAPAAWSPDSTKLAIVTYPSEGAALRPTLTITDIRTRATTALPIPGTQESRLDIAWSPNGELLAYVDAALQPSETTQLRVLRLSDGLAHEVTDSSANARSPQWTKDGRSVYFAWNKTGAADLWRRDIRPDGRPAGEAVQITTGVEVLHAAVSAAGNRLVIAKGRWVANVWRVPLGLGRPATWDDAQQITFEHAFIEFVDVSPDGRTLAFSSDRAGNQDLWTLDLQTGTTTQLTSDPAPEWAPRWSPDGRQLAFYASRTGDREIYVMDVGGGGVRRLTSSPGLDATPDWSPDGRWIAFRSERTGSSDIWVVSADGRELRPVAPHPESEYAPSWSPDGTAIAFGSHRTGRGLLWRTAFPEGEPTPLTEGWTYGTRWSRADDRIYFAGLRENPLNLWSIDPRRPGAPQQVTDLVGRRGTMVTQPPCPAKGFLYFIWRNDPADIWLMDVSGK